MSICKTLYRVSNTKYWVDRYEAIDYQPKTVFAKLLLRDNFPEKCSERQSRAAKHHVHISVETYIWIMLFALVVCSPIFCGAFSPQSRFQLKSAVDTCLQISPQGKCSNGPHGPIESWDVSRVTYMSRIFAHAKFFDRDVSNWDVSRVKDMTGMFLGATSFNGDVSTWDVSRVKDMYGMFWGATLFQRKLCGAAWVHSSAKKTIMFEGTSGSISSKACTCGDGKGRCNISASAQVFSPQSREELKDAVDTHLEQSAAEGHAPPVVQTCNHNLQITKTKPRSKHAFWATVRKAWQITPTIRGIRLEVDNDSIYKDAYKDKDDAMANLTKKGLDQDEAFDFAPGQWVNLFIPGTEMIGGYSIASTPTALPMLDLAVKFAPYPPTKWVTQTAKEGDRVGIKVGGDYVYEFSENTNAKVLLIAGGSGISPLYSILQHVLVASSACKVVLLYSARTADEFAFRSEIQRLAESFPDSLRVLFAVTGTDPNSVDDVLARHVQDMKRGQCDVLRGRMSDELLSSSVEWLGGSKDVDVLVCGPPGMPEAVQGRCAAVGVTPDRVQYEKWW